MSEIFLQRTNPLQQLQDFESKVGRSAAGGENGPSFKDLLGQALADVDQAHKASDKQIESVLAGDVQDVHSAMIAMQKADLSFQMMMQVRNKLVEAYHEVMRMQV
jgi:flagellar hook-basal body complex protein FliE